MRNLRKLTAAVLAIAIVLTSMTAAFAATETVNSDKATVLNQLGLYAGVDAKVFNPDLGAKLTRQQATVMLLKMFGLAGKASEMKAEEVTAALKGFTDADKVASWAKNAVAYAVANKIMSGMSATTIDPTANVTGAQYATLIVKSMGYEVPDFKAAVTQLSKIDGSTVKDEFADADLIRDNAVGYMYGALTAKEKDGVTVIANLVAENPTIADAATKAGLYTAPVAGGIEISSAVALNSKIVEVTLAKAATAADVTAATFTVKDSAAKEFKVVSAALAAYDTDNKTVLLTLEADTTVGTLYTVTSGTKSLNFGGRAVDTTKPEVQTVESTDYNKVKITFNEPVKLEGATVTFTQKYGAKAALAIKDTKYSGKDAIEFTTDDQTASTLYGANISNVVDLAGNKIDTIDTKTFVGQAKPTDNQIVEAAKAVDYNKIIVKFKTKVDPATIPTATYTVEEAYGTKTAFTVTAAAAVRADAAEYDDSLDTDAKKDKVVPFLVVLNVTSGEMKSSTLYKITVAGMNTLYGKPMSTTSGDNNKTFPGTAKPTGAFAYTSITTKSNTSLEVKFERKVDKTLAETVGNYAITLAYGTKAALAVSKAVLKDDGKTVTLTVAAMTGDLYKMTVTNLKDIYGNSFKTGTDADKTFVGSAIESKIDDITSIARISDTQIKVTFNKNVGTTATDVSHYSIDNGIGYPTKAETVDGDAKSVKLTIPKTVDSLSYKLTVKGLENADGVAMGSDGVTETFAGKGIAATLPVVQQVYALDKNTIEVFFDRDVTNDKIKGVIWNSDTKQLVGGIFSYATVASSSVETALAASAYVTAHQDPTNVNGLIISYDNNAEAAGVGTPFASTTSYNTFKFIIKDTKKAKYDSDSASYLEFASSSSDTAKPAIEAVQGLDNYTVKVYFTKPVKNFDAADYTISLKGSTTNIASNTTPVAVTGSNDKQWLIMTSSEMSKNTYEFKIANLASVNDKYLTDLGLEPTTTNGSTITNEFAGSDEKTNYITSVYAKMVNDRVIEVYYPEAMKIAASTVEASSTTQADYEGSYSFLKKDGSTVLSQAPVIVDVEYDNNTNKATLYLNKAMGSDQTSDNTFDLVINTAVENLMGNRSIAASSTDTGNLKVEVAKSGDANPGAKISTVTVSGDRMSMDIVMDQDVAFGSPVVFDGADATFNNYGKFATKATTTADTSLTAAQIAKAFAIKAKFATAPTTEVALNADNAADYIDTVTRSKDGKTITVKFFIAVAQGTDGTVSTEGSSFAVMNKAFVNVKTSSSDASKAAFAATNSTVFDATAPSVDSIVWTNGTTSSAIILPSGTAKVLFTEELDSTGKANVEAAFEAFDADLSYAWDGATLTLTNTSTTAPVTFTGTLTATLKDLAGNVSAAPVPVWWLN